MMRLPYRFLLVVYSLIMIILAGFAISLALGWTEPFYFLPGFFTVPANRWGVGIVSFFLLLMAFQLLLVVLRGQREHEITVQETGLGRIEIAAPALENLIRRAARQIRDVREVKPVLRYSRDGLAVFLNLNVNPEANLPAVSQTVQQVIQDYLEEKAGIRVLQVRVRIGSVSLEQRARVE
ncbi:MAG: alkaline shock response membrane anchor protein AmaP [Firmicutes bacterium]|nr:alkaline shock response membrane anchor protein AmaP [Bacillota bacterium]